MSSRYGKTKTLRYAKARKFGARTKIARENKGTTARFPLTGPIPALCRGVVVKPESIVVPAELLK